jgi:hypothetical protein
MAKFKINAGEMVELSSKVTAEAVADAVERRMISLDNPGFSLRVLPQHERVRRRGDPCFDRLRPA